MRLGVLALLVRAWHIVLGAHVDFQPSVGMTYRNLNISFSALSSGLIEDCNFVLTLLQQQHFGFGDLATNSPRYTLTGAYTSNHKANPRMV